jgi:hypothetical protein
MSKQMKYVITHDGTSVIFSEANKHSDFSHFKPVSAGFCVIHYSDNGYGFKVDAYGESISLDLKSRKEDAGIIQRMLNEY